jgi:hypothetical protein
MRPCEVLNVVQDDLIPTFSSVSPRDTGLIALGSKHGTKSGRLQSSAFYIATQWGPYKSFSLVAQLVRLSVGVSNCLGVVCYPSASLHSTQVKGVSSLLAITLCSHLLFKPRLCDTYDYIEKAIQYTVRSFTSTRRG